MSPMAHCPLFQRQKLARLGQANRGRILTHCFQITVWPIPHLPDPHAQQKTGHTVETLNLSSTRGFP